ncbi:MAG: hypothetical protein A2Z32_01865 [Chloroflexi bacterium RBG_16_69_14]|nr:MAG: hypothetical protein A2Z32_01865 [Chloroflexi bacterium RBG_16_69_14]
MADRTDSERRTFQPAVDAPVSRRSAMKAFRPANDEPDPHSSLAWFEGVAAAPFAGWNLRRSTLTRGGPRPEAAVSQVIWRSTVAEPSGAGR